MNKQELYDYIMKSPYNTNPTILKQAIEGLSNNDSNSSGLPYIELSFDGDSFTNKPLGLHTTTQECSDELTAIISKEPPAFLAMLPYPNLAFVVLFTRFGDWISEYDQQMHPRYTAEKMWDGGFCYMLDLTSGDKDWGEHDKWMMEYKKIGNLSS